MYGQFCHVRAEEAPGLVAVVATLSKGYDLDYIWKQVDRGPAKDAASYYIQASETGGEPPGRWWGPGRKDPRFGSSGRIERQHDRKAGGIDLGKVAAQRPISAISRLSRLDRPAYHLLSSKRQAPDGTPLGRAPASGRKAAEVYKALLAAAPHATAECDAVAVFLRHA